MAQTFKQTLELFGDNDDGNTYSPSGNDYPKSPVSSNAVAKDKVKDEAFASDIRGNIADQKTLLNDVLSSANTRPEAPKPLTPPKPPEFEPSNPMDAFKSFAPMLAVFGSLATRHPLQTAIGALTAATAAQQKGDNDTYEKKRQQYTDNMEYTLKLHQQQQDEYKDVLESKGKSDTDKLAIIKALAAQNKDELLLHYINAGDIDGATDLITNKRTKAGDGLRDAAGNLLPQSSPKAIDGMVEALHNGLHFSDIGLSTRTTKNPDLAAVRNAMFQKYPDFDWSKAQQDYKVDTAGKTSEARSYATRTVPAKIAIKEMDNLAPPMLKAIDALDPSEYPDFNSLDNILESKNGDPKVVAAKLAVQEFKTAFTNLMVRNGVATDQARSKTDDIMNVNFTPGQARAVVDQAKISGGAVIDAIAEAKSGKSKYHKDQIIDHGGKQYKVTGNEDSDDPDVELVQ